MNKTLIIAEKPSVALDISRALGGFAREGDYFESERYVLASSIGHLLSLVAPNDPVKGKWSFAHLPVIPPEFELGPTDKKSAERLKLLVRLAKRKDVDSIINACDAGREGELIFRYIIQYAGVKKPIQRLWLQSMTQAAIREAFANLRDDVQLKPLEAAARSRAGSRLAGRHQRHARHDRLQQQGRRLLQDAGRPGANAHAGHRGRARRAHPPLRAPRLLGSARHLHRRRRLVRRPLDRPQFKKDDRDPEKRESRLWSAAAAQSVVAACRDQPGNVTEESKPSTQMSPALYDLTSLQREANGRFGFSAKTTLSLAQTLYERHKALTYPRTDSATCPRTTSPRCRKRCARWPRAARTPWAACRATRAPSSASSG